MALVKTVELRILADAGDAQAKLDEVAGKADKLDSKAIKMRFRVDDAEGKAQLDAIRARADELGFKDVDIKIRVDKAGRAVAELTALKVDVEAEIAAIGHELDRLGEKRADPKVALEGAAKTMAEIAAIEHELDRLDRRRLSTGGLLRGLIGGGIGQAGSGIPGSVGLPVLGSVPLPALAALVPAVGAVATEVTAVAAGFAAAGAGAGAFYLLAHPAINNLQGDVRKLSAANQALGIAQQKYLIDPTKAHAKSLHEAQVTYQAVYRQLGQDAGPAAGQMLKLHDAYVKMSNAFAPQAFKVIGDGLKVVSNLLPHVTPFANTFATGLDKLLQQLGKFTQSKGFSDWLKQFHSLEGPAIGAIGHGIGEVANSVGKLMTTFSGKDVAHAINIAFGAISGTINVAGSAIHRFAQNFDGMKSAATTAVRAVGSAFSSLAGSVSGAVRGVISAWLTMVRGIERGVSDAVHAASQLPGRIRGLFSGAAGWLVSAGRNIIMGLVHGIESMVGSVASAIGHIASTIRSFLPFSPARQGPLSGQGSPDIAGRRIAAMLASGMDSGVAGVAGASGRMAGAAAVTPAMARGGAAGGGDVHVHFHGVFTGDKYGTAQQVHQLLMDFKRNRGRAPLGLG